MTWARDLLDDVGPHRQPHYGLPTGLRDLDALTGGLYPGALWLLVGTPGAGRTALACQIASTAALTGPHSVSLISGRESPGLLLANMLCTHGGIPAHHLGTNELDAGEQNRLGQASERLAATNLRLLSSDDACWQHDDSTSIPDLNQLIGGQQAPARLLVVDDIDLLLDQPLVQALPLLRHWCARAQLTLVVTTPEEHLIADGRPHPDVRRDPDVVLRLSRADQFDRDSPRAGEADLDVLSHRAGPTARITVAFQGHYRRFVDLP